MASMMPESGTVRISLTCSRTSGQVREPSDGVRNPSATVGGFSVV